jgi:hypothetical protein
MDPSREASYRVTALGPPLSDILPYLIGPLGIVEGADPPAQMDPQIKRQRTLNAIILIAQRFALLTPSRGRNSR